MRDLITTRTAGEQMGLTDRRVRQLADALGITRKLGNQRVLTPGEFRKVRLSYRRVRPYAKKGKETA